MILDDVHRGIEKRKNRKRIGRGLGSGTGKTSGKGSKGYYSRSGSPRKLGREGGQVPMARRIAKRGFNNAYFALRVAEVNLDQLEKNYENGEAVTEESLTAKNLLKGKFDILKVLGRGKLTKKLTVKAHRFSKTASDQIAAAGGAAEVILMSAT
jgi:large subunit ribosomal protein L15